jgi:hypothetical protein
MKKKIYCFLGLGFLLLSGPLSAQQDSTAAVQVIGARFFQGYMLIHSPELKTLGRPYPRGVELNFGWHKRSEKAWNSCNCYTKLGLGISIWNYDKPDVLGWGVNNLFLLEPVFGAGNRFSLFFQAGAGISFQNQPYDPETNPNNLGYSTYVAIPLRLGVGTYIRLHPRWYLDVFLAYNHISNGGMKEPNKGLNWPTASLGVNYYLEEPRFFRREKTPWRSLGPPMTRYDLSLFTTYQQPRNEKLVFSVGAEFKYSRQVARLNAVTGGVEWFFDNGRRNLLEMDTLSGQAQTIGFAVGHEFLLGRFLFSQQFGVYVLNPTNQSADVYQRYGLVYRISQRIGLGIALKAHGHVADFLDIRFAWNLKGRGTS